MVLPSTTCYQRKLDNIFLSINYNKRKWRTNVKAAVHYMQPVKNKVNQCIDIAISFSSSQVIVVVVVVVFFRRMSNFGHVIYYMASTKGG